MPAAQFRLDSAPETVRSAIDLGRFAWANWMKYRDFRAGVYDGRGRLVSVTYGDGTKIVYGYDAAGNRTTQVITRPLTGEGLCACG